MKIICRLLLAMACLCLANISWATVCANSTGVAEDEHYDLSNVFNSTNNQPGQIVVLPEKSGWVGVGKSNASRAMVREISRILGIEIDISKITPPPAPFPEIDLNVCSGDPITNAVIASYDPRTDTTNLRYAPEQFENLRGNYGLRREFGAYKIMLSASEKIPVLKELGFISPSKS